MLDDQAARHQTDANPANGGIQFTANGNVQTLYDSVTGPETFTYDTLNRLTSAQYGSSSGVRTLNWTYDNVGNRCAEFWTSGVFANPGATAICSSSMWSSDMPVSDLANAPLSSWATYNAANQVSGTSGVPAGYSYDAAGRVLFDGNNT